VSTNIIISLQKSKFNFKDVQNQSCKWFQSATLKVTLKQCNAMDQAFAGVLPKSATTLMEPKLKQQVTFLTAM